MKKLFIRFLLSNIIGGAMLYLASGEVNFANTWKALKSFQWTVTVPFFLIMCIQHFFRSWRWKHLLAPIQEVPFSRILPIATVGFFAILALPLRMGELVRPYLIADPPRLTMSHGLGTMAVERVFDGLFLALTAFISVALAQSQGPVPRWIWVAGWIALVLFLVALVVLIMALWQRDRAVSLCRRLFGLFSKRLGDRLARIAGGIVDGFKVLPNWRRLLPYIGATLLYWTLNATAVWILARSFDLSLTLGQSFAVMSLVGIGIMIPAGPGFVGNFEWFAQGALGLYVTQSQLEGVGGAFILTFHAMNALWYILAGTVALFSKHISFNRVWQASTSQVSPPANG